MRKKIKVILIENDYVLYMFTKTTTSKPNSKKKI